MIRNQSTTTALVLQFLENSPCPLSLKWISNGVVVKIVGCLRVIVVLSLLLSYCLSLSPTTLSFWYTAVAFNEESDVCVYVCAPARSGFHLHFLFDFHFFLFIVFKNLFQSAKTSYDLSLTTAAPTYLYLFWLFGDGV